MKQISQEEFEKEVERLLEGSITRKKLAKELETDIRTLNNRITELSQTNSELYARFIKKFPYRPKTIKVDIEDLALQVIREGVGKTSDMTGISVRTISRKIKTLEETNPELYNLYIRKNDKMTSEQRKLFDDTLERFQMKSGDSRVTRGELIEKEQELRMILSKFEGLVSSGMSKAEAARTLGYDGYPTIWKKYSELKRIEAQKEGLQETKQNAAERFRDSMRVQVEDNGIKIQSGIETEENQHSKEGIIEKD